MLEQLQHLQRQIKILVDHSTHLEHHLVQENQLHNASTRQLQSELNQAQGLVQDYQERLKLKQTDAKQQQQQLQQLQNEHKSLDEKYLRLENSCAELRKRFEALIQQRNQLKDDYETLIQQNDSLQKQIQELSSHRDQLLNKNEQAKLKVEAIIQRLAILGTAQDIHAQEIQKLADPSAENLDENSNHE